MFFEKAESHIVHPKPQRNNKCRNKTCLQKIKCQNQKAAMNLLNRNLKEKRSDELLKPACTLREGLALFWNLKNVRPRTAAKFITKS